MVSVPRYGKICVVSLACKNNQKGERIKEEKSICNIVMIQICGENGQKWTFEAGINEEVG